MARTLPYPIFRSCLIVAAFVFSISSLADETVKSTVAVAPVTLDGTVLFHVRGALGLPAEERARLISGRIADFAANTLISTQTLQSKSAGDRTLILAGDRLLVTIVDADASIDGLTQQQVAEILSRQINNGVERYRTDRTPTALWHSGLASLIATILTGGLWLGVRLLGNRLSAVVERRYRRHIEQLEVETRKIVKVERLQTTLRGVFGVASSLIQVVLVVAYLEFVLGQWPWTRPLADQVIALVLDPLRAIGTAVLDSIPGLVFIAVLAFVIKYVLKAAHLFFTGIANGSIVLRDFDQDWAWPTYRILRFLTITFAIVVAYPYIPGSDSLAFKGISIFMGILFSLGSTSLISNVVAGYTLVYRRAFKVGDRVRIGEHVGDITAIRLQVTSLRSLKNEEVVIPNSVVMSSSSINYSILAAKAGLILHTSVGIGYETPWRQVEAMLIEAARRTPGLLQEPPPYILQKKLDDFCVVYELNVYCDQPKQSERLYTTLHQNILDVFNEHHVQIMTPAYVSDPAIPKVVERENWYLSPAPPPSPKSDR